MCEKLHVLPDEGGLFDQDEKTIDRLLSIYKHVEEFRMIEIKKPPKE